MKEKPISKSPIPKKRYTSDRIAPEAIAAAIPEKFVVPVAPYVSAAPKRKKPVAKAPSNKYFNPHSLL